MEAEAWRARAVMVKALARNLLLAVAYCHRKGVVHGSISSGSVFVSTTEDAEADELLVKLDNFGFGKLYAGGALRLWMVQWREGRQQSCMRCAATSTWAPVYARCACGLLRLQPGGGACGAEVGRCVGIARPCPRQRRWVWPTDWLTD